MKKLVISFTLLVGMLSGGFSQIKVADNNNVGIGVAEPVSKLAVASAGDTKSTLYVENSTTSGSQRAAKFFKSASGTYGNPFSFGNLTKTVIVGKRGQSLAVDSIETDLTFSSDGRFLLSKSAPLDHDETFEYDASTGLLETQTAPNRKETTFEYGPFNRQKKTVHQNMSEETSLLLWNNEHTDAPSGALFYNWAAASGTPPILTFYDDLGRELRSVTTGFGDETIYTDTEYDSKGILYIRYPFWRDSVNT